MSKITNGGLTRPGTRFFIAVPIWKQWVSRVKIRRNSEILIILKKFVNILWAILKPYSTVGTMGCAG